MPQYVTIEGSIRPCTELPRGVRKTVALTDRVKSLIKRGFFDVIEIHDDLPGGALEPIEPDDEHGDVSTDAGLTEPKITQSTADWKAWFDAQLPPLGYPEDVTRKQLINAWMTIKQAKAQAG